MFKNNDNLEFGRKNIIRNNHKINLIAIDLDGTLLDSNSKISHANITAINECINRKINVVITTAKTVYCVKKLIRFLNLKSPQIASSGAVIISNDFKPINIHKISFRSFKKIVNLSRKYNVGLGISCLDGYVYYEEEDPSLKYIWDTGEMPRKIKNLLVEDVVKQALLATITVNIKHLFNNIITDELGGDIRIIRGGERFLICHNKETSKLDALRKILKILNLDISDIMAIGDSESDIDIINFAGLGVAMGNSTANVKKKADFIVGDNDNHGVSEAINKFVLN